MAQAQRQLQSQSNDLVEWAASAYRATLLLVKAAPLTRSSRPGK